jgi:hypothetical protein
MPTQSDKEKLERIVKSIRSDLKLLTHVQDLVYNELPNTAQYIGNIVSRTEYHMTEIENL